MLEHSNQARTFALIWLHFMTCKLFKYQTIRIFPIIFTKMHLAASSNESDILCIFGWSISKSIEKMRPQHVEPFPIVVAAVDARFDWRRSNNTKSNEPNFNCRRLWKEINCQSRFKCTTFKSSKECFHQGSPARKLRTRPRSADRNRHWSTTEDSTTSVLFLDS